MKQALVLTAALAGCGYTATEGDRIPEDFHWNTMYAAGAELVDRDQAQWDGSRIGYHLNYLRILCHHGDDEACSSYFALANTVQTLWYRDNVQPAGQ